MQYYAFQFSSFQCAFQCAILARLRFTKHVCAKGGEEYMDLVQCSFFVIERALYV